MESGASAPHTGGVTALPVYLRKKWMILGIPMGSLLSGLDLQRPRSYEPNGAAKNSTATKPSNRLWAGTVRSSGMYAH